MFRFSHENCFFQPPPPPPPKKIFPGWAMQQKHHEGNTFKTSFWVLPTKNTLMQIMLYVWDNIYTDPSWCRYYRPLLYNIFTTVTAHLHVLLLPISFYNSSVHENILQPWDFYSNIFTSLFLLFVIKSPYLLWVRRELTLEFLKEGKNLCDASQWAVEGESLQPFVSVIFSQVSLTQHIFLFFSYTSMWEKPHMTIAVPQIWYVFAGFHRSLLILEWFLSSVLLIISKNWNSY